MNPTLVKHFTKDEWQQHTADTLNPADGAVWVAATKCYVTDWGCRYSGPPEWYFLNHSDTPNLVMHWDKEKGVVVWVTRRPIAEGEELTFRYGEGTAKWRSCWTAAVCAKTVGRQA